MKAIVFDAYGTLLNVNSLDKVLAKYFGDQSVQLSALWRSKQLQYTWLRTLMGRYEPFSKVTMEALDYSCKSLGFAVSEEIRNELHDQYLKLEAYEEVPALISKLAEKLPLGILSNANQQMLQGAVVRNELEGLFVHVISVEEISLFKPRPEVYQLACRRFDLAPDEILFVSSNTWDVSGAKSYGLKVAWLNRFDGVMEELGYQPDYLLNDMQQLWDILSSSTSG
jgi:2-haloacid dehalogenase